MNKDKVLQMESQVEELAAVRQKNKNLEDGVNSLKQALPNAKIDTDRNPLWFPPELR